MRLGKVGEAKVTQHPRKAGRLARNGRVEWVGQIDSLGQSLGSQLAKFIRGHSRAPPKTKALKRRDGLVEGQLVRGETNDNGGSTGLGVIPVRKVPLSRSAPLVAAQDIPDHTGPGCR